VASLTREAGRVALLQPIASPQTCYNPYLDDMGMTSTFMLCGMFRRNGDTQTHTFRIRMEEHLKIFYDHYVSFVLKLLHHSRNFHLAM